MKNQYSILGRAAYCLACSLLLCSLTSMPNFSSWSKSAVASKLCTDSFNVTFLYRLPGSCIPTVSQPRTVLWSFLVAPILVCFTSEFPGAEEFIGKEVDLASLWGHFLHVQYTHIITIINTIVLGPMPAPKMYNQDWSFDFNLKFLRSEIFAHNSCTGMAQTGLISQITFISSGLYRLKGLHFLKLTGSGLGICKFAV